MDDNRCAMLITPSSIGIDDIIANVRSDATRWTI